MEIEPVAGQLSELEEPHLCEVLDGVWGLLARGAAERDHGFRLPVLATVRPDGAPAARTVVLRGVDREARRLQLHTDARSPKLADLAGQPRAALCFYDAAEQTQLRVEARVAVERESTAAEAAWRASGLPSRRCYLQEAAPGSRLDGAGSALPAGLDRRPPSATEAAGGRDNFALLACRVGAIDWFYLSADGNRRARFAWDDAGRLEAEWLAP